MTLADRIAVMDRGQVMQVGPPSEVYEHPASRFVANFLGTVSQFEARVVSAASGLARVEVPDFGTSVEVADPGARPGETVTLAIRPEKVALGRARPEGGVNAIEGSVKDLAYFGKDSLYRIVLPSGALLSVHAVNARRGAEGRPDWDDSVWVSFDPAAALLLRD